MTSATGTPWAPQHRHRLPGGHRRRPLHGEIGAGPPGREEPPTVIDGVTHRVARDAVDLQLHRACHRALVDPRPAAIDPRPRIVTDDRNVHRLDATRFPECHGFHPAPRGTYRGRR